MRKRSSDLMRNSMFEIVLLVYQRLQTFKKSMWTRLTQRCKQVFRTKQFSNSILNTKSVKYIAAAVLLIDSGFAILVPQMARNHASQWFPIYQTVRSIGTLMIPLYSMLLVQGCEYTRNKILYIARMLLCAIIVEGFYFQFIHHQVVFDQTHNVLWGYCLAIGLIYTMQWVDQTKVLAPGKYFIYYLLVFVGVLGAKKLQVDYGPEVVFAAALLFIFLKYRTFALLLLSLLALDASMRGMLIGIGILFFYNYEKRVYFKKLEKWMFYALYPIFLGVYFLILAI